MIASPLTFPPVCSECWEDLTPADAGCPRCVTCRRIRFRAIEVKIRLARIVVSRFASSHDGTAFEAPTCTGRPVIVHRCPTRADRAWRVTYFDVHGPAGHCYAEDYRDACKIAAGEFAADLSRATFAAWKD